MVGNTRVMKFGALLLVFASHLTFAATSDDEITDLIDVLRSSQCQFERSGRWYDSEKAADHLQDKWDYAKDDIKSTEDFINNVANGSWMSGDDYHVKCPGQEEMTSRAWLLQQLQLQRTQ